MGSSGPSPADWIDADTSPAHAARVRAEKERVHQAALGIYRGCSAGLPVRGLGADGLGIGPAPGGSGQEGRPGRWQAGYTGAESA